MSLKKRIVSFLLSAVMLIAPCASLAESNYYAGELSMTAVSDSYYAGNQVNLDVVFGVDAQREFASDRLQAAVSLLGKSRLHMSFYDDFGTARIHAELHTDGVELAGADVLVFGDGSVQMMSSLTGNMVLTLPAGTVTESGISLASFTDTDVEYDFKTRAGIAAFKALPARTRLSITANDMISMLINHLLGWVSYAQMDSDGQLYVFDDTYIDETETRDAVAQRMLGTIDAHRFNTLFSNIAMTIADEKGDFQQAIADVLADMGVTRYQARMFTDSLMTEETIDPAIDFVQPSYYIIENKDESPITYNDVSYFFKKLEKCAERLWRHSTDEVMSMDVSYDDFGGTVGFDAHLAKFSTELPYEGTFSYSVKTDEDWQRLHTAHGELQVYNDNRVNGDLSVLLGEDVDGVNASSITGAADVVNQKDGSYVGVGVDGSLVYEVEVLEEGKEAEEFEGSLVVSERMNGESKGRLAATLSGVTMVDAERFDLLATAALEAEGIATLVADVALVQADYEEITFAGGQAIDLTSLDDAKIEQIKSEVKKQAAKVGLGLVAHPSVLADMMTLFVK